MRKSYLKKRGKALIGMVASLFLAFVAMSPNVYGQCALGTNGGNLAAPTASITTLTYNVGQQNFLPVVTGAEYRISTCATIYDTRLTLFNGNSAVGFNDNDGPACSGSRASVDWVSTFSGNVGIQVNNSACGYRSTSAVLSYNQNDNISIPTPSDATAAVGGDATFSVTPSAGAGASFSYQWQRNIAGEGFSDIDGATSASYTETAVSAEMNNWMYRCNVTLGAITKTSSAATLSVGCATPTGATFSDFGTSAILSWNQLSGNQGYTVRYGIDGQTWGEMTLITTAVDENTIVIEGIDASANYVAYVFSVCEGAEKSGFSRTFLNRGCTVPTGITASNISTSGTATVTWNAVSGAQSYTVRYGVEGTAWTSLTETSVSSNSIELTGLSDQSHIFYVRAICGTFTRSPFSAPDTFTPACDMPTGLMVSNVTATTATLSWNQVSNSGYTVRYGVVGDTWGNMTVVPTQTDINSIDLIGLTEGVQYRFYVQTNCFNGTSTAYIQGPRFRPVNAGGRIDMASNANLVVYPNPSSGIVTVKNTDLTGNTMLRIYNSVGVLVSSKEINGAVNETITLSDKGLYIVQLFNGEQVLTQRVVVE
jgi:hypothetical protein